MKHPEADCLLNEACRRGILGQILEEYIASCHTTTAESPPCDKKARGTMRGERFPNLAGFCRYLGCSTEEWVTMEEKHPKEFGRLRATLEDEALNAAMSPTVIAAYLKKRLGYDKDANDAEGPLTVHFEHDIFSDGE